MRPAHEYSAGDLDIDYVAEGAPAASLLLFAGGTESAETVIVILHGEKAAKNILPETRAITKETQQ